MGKDLKFAQLNMSLSVGPNRMNMMLFLVQLSRMRSVLMSHLVTPPSPSAPSGPERSALWRRRLSEIHSHHWMYQGTQRGVCSCWLWIQEGAEVCYDKTSTIVQDAPKEECNLEPQRTCADVTKEVCTRSRTNPRKVKKPVVKKWCYVPTEES